MRYVLEKTALQQIESFDQKTKTVTVADDSLLREYITSHSAAKYLFPENRVIVDFMPYRLVTSNVPLMSQAAGFTEVFTDVRFESGKQKGLLSFGTSFKVPAFSSRYNIDVYGDDTGSFERHVQKHLSRLKQKVDGTSAVLVFVEESFPAEVVDEVLQRYGATKDNSSPRHQFLFEMQV